MFVHHSALNSAAAWSKNLVGTARAGGAGASGEQNDTASAQVVPAEASEALINWRETLHHVAGYSTVGIETLSGVSPKNAALVQLAQGIKDLPSAEEQIAAIDDLLGESAKLFPDQHAYVMTRVMQSLMDPQGITLQPRAASRVGRKLLLATIKVAPELITDNQIADTLVLDCLKDAIVSLVQQPDFGMYGNVRHSLEDAGLLEPSGAEKYRRAWDETPECAMFHLRHEILSMGDEQITAGQLDEWIEAGATLPDHLRGYILTLLANTFWNAIRDPETEPLVQEIGQMILDLPIKIRLTALEACYNQLERMPHEMARNCHFFVADGVTRIPETQDFRLNRSRRDLLQALAETGELLENARLRPGETLAHYMRRTPSRQSA